MSRFFGTILQEFDSRTYFSCCFDGFPFTHSTCHQMRNFFRAYESTPDVSQAAMSIGWTQNVVILEAELTLQEKAWYIQAVQQFGWSKLKLMEQIASAAHPEMALDLTSEVCYTEENSVKECSNDGEHSLYKEDLQRELSSGTAQANEALNPWVAGSYATGTPIPMGTTPAPALEDDTRNMSGGRPFFDHRAGRYSMRAKMAARSPRVIGKLSRSSKCSAATNRISPRLCWEPTTCFKIPAFPPWTARIGWNSS